MTQINVYKERWDEDFEDRFFQLFSRRYCAEADIDEKLPYGMRRVTVRRWGYTANGALKRLQKELKIRAEYPGGEKLVQIWTEPGERVSDD